MKIFLALLFLFEPSCATYQASVDSRSVSAAVNQEGGKVVYTVHYR